MSMSYPCPACALRRPGEALKRRGVVDVVAEPQQSGSPRITARFRCAHCGLDRSATLAPTVEERLKEQDDG